MSPGSSGRSTDEVPGGDEPVGVEHRGDGLDELERDVGDGEPGGRKARAASVGRARVDLDVVRPGVFPCDLDGDLVDVDGGHGREAELRGRDRDDARAAADVEDAARRLVEKQLECESGRGMRPGSEGSAGVDHDRDGAGRRLLPGRADPERADLDAVVELAPAVLPALVDCGDERVRVGREDALGGWSVGGELDAAGRLGFLEPVGRKLDESGPELLGLVGGRGDCGADQLKMFRSFSKNPWWCS